MVLSAPGPLLAQLPSSSPPKTPHRSYSAQTRSQNEEKNHPPPKLYLPLQTRTRHERSHNMMLDSPHTSAPMLMRGNIPPTTRFPPHRSRPAGYPPNRQPATVGEEERGGRDPTSRRMSTHKYAPTNLPRELVVVLFVHEKYAPYTSVARGGRHSESAHGTLLKCSAVRPSCVIMNDGQKQETKLTVVWKRIFPSCYERSSECGPGNWIQKSAPKADWIQVTGPHSQLLS
jgi:hypothetical protein